MLKIQYEDGGLLLRLQGLTEGLRDLSPAWPAVHDIFGDFIKKNFETEGGYTGQRWAPLSPAYAAWKQRNYPGKGLLHMTERLYPSLVEQGHPDHVFNVGPGFVEMGTRVPYAWAQHAGWPPTNLPARVVIPEPTKVEGARIVDAILAFLFRAMRRRG